jgi:DNA-directed RNA polymerase sigma subunit (sigma70/sigma32)
MDAAWAKAANLTVEELHTQLRAGRQATDDLVAMNAPLVLSVAKKYTK